MGSFKKNYIIKTLFQKKLNSSIEPFFFLKKIFPHFKVNFNKSLSYALSNKLNKKDEKINLLLM
jgi:hypothetical protein